VKNADTADVDTKGFCRYKATNGIKRHLCVDVLGTPFFLICTPANVSDDEGFLRLFSENIDFFKALPVISEEYALTILFDSGYNKSNIEKRMQFLYSDILSKIRIEIAAKISPEEKKKKGLSGFIVIHKRWVVERSNSWIDKCRILWKNCASSLKTSEAEIRLCFIRLILRRLC
jgi:transposase